MLVLQLFESLFGSGRRTPHALEEHLGECVARVDLGLVEETEEQAVAPRLVSNVAHATNVQGGSFRGKLLDLRVGNLGETGTGRYNGFKPPEACGPLPQVLQRGLTRRLLDPRKIGATVTDVQEGIKAFPLSSPKRRGDAGIEILMGLVPDVHHQAV